MNRPVESVKMLERRFNLFPARFRWRGQVYKVDAVNECKTETNPWNNHTVYHFWVRCSGRQLHLGQVLPLSDWILYEDDKEVKK